MSSPVRPKQPLVVDHLNDDETKADHVIGILSLIIAKDRHRMRIINIYKQDDYQISCSIPYQLERADISQSE